MYFLSTSSKCPYECYLPMYMHIYLVSFVRCEILFFFKFRLVINTYDVILNCPQLFSLSMRTKIMNPSGTYRLLIFSWWQFTDLPRGVSAVQRSDQGPMIPLRILHLDTKTLLHFWKTWLNWFIYCSNVLQALCRFTIAVQR